MWSSSIQFLIQIHTAPKSNQLFLVPKVHKNSSIHLWVIRLANITGRKKDVTFFVEVITKVFVLTGKTHGNFRHADSMLRQRVSECVGLKSRPTHNRSFRDESFQAIHCTGTDNQKWRNKTLHTPETQDQQKICSR